MTSLCEGFLEDYAKSFCKPSTQKGDEIVIRTSIRPYLGARKIADICRKDVVTLHHKMRDKPYIEVPLDLQTLCLVILVPRRDGHEQGNSVYR